MEGTQVPNGLLVALDMFYNSMHMHSHYSLTPNNLLISPSLSPSTPLSLFLIRPTWIIPSPLQIQCIFIFFFFFLWFRTLDFLIPAHPNMTWALGGSKLCLLEHLKDCMVVNPNVSFTGDLNGVYNEIWCLVGYLSMLVRTREGRWRSWCWMRKGLFPLDPWTSLML